MSTSYIHEGFLIDTHTIHVTCRMDTIIRTYIKVKTHINVWCRNRILDILLKFLSIGPFELLERKKTTTLCFKGKIIFPKLLPSRYCFLPG